jgi:long-subunit acyl-CoA synthetase (AMP-forming)/alkylation response protein AidB-like acyl-CoA dehydrogenase
MQPHASSRDASAATAALLPADTLVGLLAQRVQHDGDRGALRTPAASRIGNASSPELSGCSTWHSLAAAAMQLAARLEAEGLSRGDRLAHSGPHTADWVLVDLACLLAGIVHVPLHAEMTTEARRHWCEWLRVEAVLVSGRGHQALAAMPCRQLDWRCHTPNGLLATAPSPAPDQLAASLAERIAACDPDQEAVILFSSGTTGRGRGVVHSQRSLAANAVASAGVFLEEPEDVRLAWLPMTHSLARTGDLGTALVRGACLAIVEDRTRLLDAAQEVSPTVILGVPAFYERLEQALAAGQIDDLPARLGGRVRVCVSGGAPLRQRTIDAFASAGVPLVQGYGLAEAGPVISLASPRNQMPGTVGPPLAGVDVRVNGENVLEVRSPGLALGTIEAGNTTLHSITTGGWLTTGDLGALDANGHLRLSGRAGDTLVLAGGEKLSPADIEAFLAEDPAIAQVCVLGHGLRRPVAVIVPEPAVFRDAVRSMRLRVISRRQALRHPRLVAWLTRRIAWRQRHLPRAWQVNQMLLLDRSFDPHSGEVTAAMKLRRQTIAKGLAKEMATAATPHAEPRPDNLHPIRSAATVAGSTTPAASCLWQGSASGSFAAAAEAAAAPLPAAMASLESDAVSLARRMRDDGSLFDEAGRLAATAEEALAKTGLFGLAVPEPHGGSAAGMQQLCRVVSHLGSISPTSAGMLSVHSTIGAVWALRDFGTQQQQQRHLPALARGTPLSVFAATEPDAGCDLGRVATTLTRHEGRLLLTGEKMFITGATHGRLVKLLARDADHGNAPVIILVRLPAQDTDQVQLERCQLHPLKHAHNKLMRFDRYEVSAEDILTGPAKPGRAPDAMQIVWHGLNRGRVTLAAQAVGTLSLMLGEAVAYARQRETWGQPIASRELIQGRVARIAAAAFTCEAVASWAAHSIDAGGSGELEAIVAKVTASGLVREAAADAYGIHGGRAFLRGHPLGDSLHDHFAVNTYEGESGLLELALFKGLVKRHPLAARRSSSPLSMLLPALRLRATRWGSAAEDRSILDARFRGFAAAARQQMRKTARDIERAIRRHGRGLAEHQLLVGSLAARVREQLVILAVAHHADRVTAAAGDTAGLAAAETACRLALARSSGRHLATDDLTCLATTGKTFLSQERSLPHADASP